MRYLLFIVVLALCGCGSSGGGAGFNLPEQFNTPEFMEFIQWEYVIDVENPGVNYELYESGAPKRKSNHQGFMVEGFEVQWFESGVLKLAIITHPNGLSKHVFEQYESGTPKHILQINDHGTVCDFPRCFDELGGSVECIGLVWLTPTELPRCDDAI